MVLIHKNFFPPYSWVFFTKNQKNLKVGKIRKNDETEYFEKKSFHLLKKHLYQNGKAQIIAGGSRPSSLSLFKIGHQIPTFDI